MVSWQCGTCGAINDSDVACRNGCELKAMREHAEYGQFGISPVAEVGRNGTKDDSEDTTEGFAKSINDPDRMMATIKELLAESINAEMPQKEITCLREAVAVLRDIVQILLVINKDATKETNRLIERVAAQSQVTP